MRKNRRRKFFKRHSSFSRRSKQALLNSFLTVYLSNNLETHFTSRNFSSFSLHSVPDIAGNESIMNVCGVLHSLAGLLARLVLFYYYFFFL